MYHYECHYQDLPVTTITAASVKQYHSAVLLAVVRCKHAWKVLKGAHVVLQRVTVARPAIDVHAFRCGSHLIKAHSCATAATAGALLSLLLLFLLLPRLPPLLLLRDAVATRPGWRWHGL